MADQVKVIVTNWKPKSIELKLVLEGIIFTKVGESFWESELTPDKAKITIHTPEIRDYLNAMKEANLIEIDQVLFEASTSLEGLKCEVGDTLMTRLIGRSLSPLLQS